MTQLNGKRLNLTVTCKYNDYTFLLKKNIKSKYLSSYHSIKYVFSTLCTGIHKTENKIQISYFRNGYSYFKTPFCTQQIDSLLKLWFSKSHCPNDKIFATFEGVFYQHTIGMATGTKCVALLVELFLIRNFLYLSFHLHKMNKL